MIKYFCDLCGEEVEEWEYHRVSICCNWNTSNGRKIDCICSTCRQLIENFIDNNLDKKVNNND